MDIASQATIALRWNAAVRLTGQVVIWSITLLVMRLLTPADYGLMAMTTVFLEFLVVLAEMGMSTAITQAPDIDERKLRQTFGLALLLNLGMALVLLCGAPLISRFYAEPRLTAVVRAFSLQFLMSVWTTIPRGLLQRRLNFRVLSQIQLGGMVANALVTLTMAAAGKGVWALVVGSLTSVLVQVVALNLACPFWKRPLFSLDSAKTMVTFGANITGAALLWLFWSQADALVAGRLLGKHLLGAYAIGNQIASIPLTRFSQIVSQVAFAAFARLQEDPEAVRRSLLRSLSALAMGAFPVFWGVSCTAPELIAVAIGPRWSAAVLPLAILALVMPFRLLSNFMSVAVRSFGRADVDFRNTMAAAVVMPAAFYVGCRSYGMAGLCAAWLTAYPCVLVWNLRNLLRVMNYRSSDLLRVVAVPACAGAAMYAATALLRWWVRPWLTDLPRAGLLVLSGAAVYSGLVWVFDRSTVLTVIRLLRSFAGLQRKTASVDRP